MVIPLAITSPKRHPDFPDMPTTAELGYPTVTAAHWMGLSGPPKMPQHIVKVWDEAFQEMLKDPEFLQKLRNIGAVPFYHNANQMIDLVKRDMKAVAECWGKK
jgi:tripartite-type tricarboxylate transporter receptor subunit TctC